MVQYKKDEIKEKIDQAALIVFAEKGYKNTKVTDISMRSGVSVGNIYRYYKSKNQIFNSIMPDDFLKGFKDLLVNKISKNDGRNPGLIDEKNEFWLTNNEVIKFMIENREGMLIIFSNNKGTKYENAKSELVEFLIETIQKIHPKQYITLKNKNKTSIVIYSIYENLINLTLIILAEAENIEELRTNLSYINSYHMFGITSILNYKGVSIID